MSGEAQVFVLIAFGFLVSAGLFAVLGWATSLPDGTTRYARRLWAWVCLAGNFVFNFGAFHDHWWNWALMLPASFYALDRIDHWWKQLELARRFEREYARHYGVTR